jgi:hypothetical protein
MSILQFNNDLTNHTYMEDHGGLRLLLSIQQVG